MALFRLIKYSSIIYFLTRHRSKLLRSAGVLLFAFVTSLLYEDVRVYLAAQHPGTLIYALLAKIIIVYGSLAFVLLQFRSARSAEKGAARAKELASDNSQGAWSAGKKKREEAASQAPKDRLDALGDLKRHSRLRTRYDRILSGDAHATIGNKAHPGNTKTATRDVDSNAKQ